METAKSLSVKVVREPEAARVLTNPRTLQQLAPFLGRECSVSAAADELGMKPNSMLAKVRRFVSLELLQVTREQPRKGRAIKLYRASTDCFFVPFEATSAETLEVALAERGAYWEALLRKNVVRARAEAIGSWGTRIYRDERGRLQFQMALTPEKNTTMLEPAGPAVLSSWRDSVYLDFEDAKALQHEMFNLLLRYQQKRGAQRYIVRLGMAPVLEP